MDPKLVEVPGEAPGDLIRKFSDANIRGSIDRALATLAPEKTFAVVLTGEVSDGGKVEIAYIHRLGDDWSIVALGGYKLRDKELYGQVQAIWSR